MNFDGNKSQNEFHFCFRFQEKYILKEQQHSINIHVLLK